MIELNVIDFGPQDAKDMISSIIDIGGTITTYLYGNRLVLSL